MIIAIYYIGLLGWAVGLVLTRFMSVDQEEKFGRLFLLLMFLYLALGAYLFGWKLGLANVVLLYIVANVLDIPLEKLVKHFYPNATYRLAMNVETARKIRQIGIKLGLGKRGA